MSETEKEEEEEVTYDEGRSLRPVTVGRPSETMGFGLRGVIDAVEVNRGRASLRLIIQRRKYTTKTQMTIKTELSER